jgi:hypothetical protein
MKATKKAVTKKAAAAKEVPAVPALAINEDTAAAIIDMLDRKLSAIQKSGREIWLISGIVFSKNEIRKSIQ